MSSCNSNSFTDFIARCTDAIRVYAQLDPFTNYSWVIEDKFGNKYKGNFTTDTEGFWEIPVDDTALPPGMFTEYSGTFKITVLDATSCKPVKFKMASDYSEISFEVSGGNMIKDNLGCSFVCSGTSGAAPLLFPFEAESDPIEIAWEDYVDVYGNAPQVQVFAKKEDAGPYDNIYELITAQVTQTLVDGVVTAIVVTPASIQPGYIIIQ